MRTLGGLLLASSVAWSGELPAATPDAPSVASEPPPGAPARYEEPPDTLDYEEGDPIPDGYRLETSTRYDIAFSGLGTMLAAYTFAIVSAAALPGMNKSVGGGGKMAETAQVWPLNIPVVGPIIACGTAEGSQFAAVGPSLGGQLLGFTLFVVGLVSEEQELVRGASSVPRIRVSPHVGGDRIGLEVGGTL